MQEASGLYTTPHAARTISREAWNSPAEYPSWVGRCDIKGSDGTMLNPIFWKKVQGQNILGGERLQNAKYLASKSCLKQIPKVTSILVLHYLSKSKTQLVNQRKQNVAFNPGTAHSPFPLPPKTVLSTVMPLLLLISESVRDWYIKTTVLRLPQIAKALQDPMDYHPLNCVCMWNHITSVGL